MIGPFSSFITFPATLVNFDWSTYEGSKGKPLENVKDAQLQDMTIQMSMQYKLVQENVGKLYKYKVDYENSLLRQWAESAIRDAVGKFGNTDFWTNRAKSAEIIQQAIDAKFKENNNFATCVSVQIILISLQPVRE